MARFLTSSKGKKKVADENNYIYDFHSHNLKLEKDYWRCELRKSCSVRIHTVMQEDTPKIVYVSGEHKHPAEKALVTARSAVAEMKDEAVQSISKSVRNIISESVNSLDENTRAQLPSIPVLARTLHKHRKIVDSIPTLPSTRHGFEIPESFRNLSNGEKFLQFDSGSQDTNRILIFATDSGLSDLAKFPIWSCDGTFKSAPNQWAQLFCVHVQIGESSFPRLYALLPDKTKTTYERLFSQLKTLQPLLNPSELMVDFEIAIHRAFTSIFPNCSTVGCLFHLGQSLYRKITDLGLREKYNTESDFCLKVRSFSALAFIPVADVEEAYEELTDDDEIPGEFISYFDVNYMGVVRGHGRRRRREPPLFPMTLWNVNSRVVNNLPRTNNALEGYHSSLKLSLGATHPNIWRLIKSLENETGLIQTKIDHIHRGDTVHKHKKYRQINQRIHNLVAHYDSYEKMEFLKAVAHNLHSF